MTITTRRERAIAVTGPDIERMIASTGIALLQLCWIRMIIAARDNSAVPVARRRIDASHALDIAIFARGLVLEPIAAFDERAIAITVLRILSIAMLGEPAGIALLGVPFEDILRIEVTVSASRKSTVAIALVCIRGRIRKHGLEITFLGPEEMSVQDTVSARFIRSAIIATAVARYRVVVIASLFRI
jgi:hypothetical protein